jgi:cysteinyl-tRNA synthetase
MKFELKTDNEKYSKSFLNVFVTFSMIVIIIIFSDIAIKLGTISRHYQTDYSCKLLVVEKSTSNFKKLFKLSKIKSKQRILEFCKELLK